MSMKKWTACWLALCLGLSCFAAGALAEEGMMAEDAAVFAVPEAAPEEIAQEEPAIEEEQMAQDEVVLDSTPTLIAPSQPHEEMIETPVHTSVQPARDRGEGPVYVLENGARHFGQPEEFTRRFIARDREVR